MKLELLNHKPKKACYKHYKMWRNNQQKLSPSLPEKYSFSFLPGYAKVRFKQRRVEGCMGRGKEREVT